MTTKTKPASKTKKQNPEATERLQGRVEGDQRTLGQGRGGRRLPPTAATPAPEGGKEPKKDKKAGGLAKLAKSAAGEGAAKQLGGLDAAAIVLKKAGVPLTCKEMWAKIDEQKLWFTEGKTPEATIYSAIL